ncbi:MAG: sulfotransferase domain-containing protein [Nocardioidaceae bacterium]
MTTRALTRTGAAGRARRHLLHLSQSAARAKSSFSLTPGFVIVGAQRCGTTSMFKTLMQHPDVAKPFLRKGIHYFDINYSNSWDWYRGHFPLSAPAQARRGGRPPLTGESSPYYMFHPRVPARLAEDLPDAKVMVLLRDPVERAYSGHAHERARGYESLDFEAALEAEPKRLDGERERLLADPAYDSPDWQHHSYLTRGQYIDQLEVLEQVLGRDRLLVVDSGDFFTDPEPVFAEVRGFLGLRPHGGIVFERHNARHRSPMEPGLRRRLEAHFAPYDERLVAWWGRVPSWRRE